MERPKKTTQQRFFSPFAPKPTATAGPITGPITVPKPSRRIVKAKRSDWVREQFCDKDVDGQKVGECIYCLAKLSYGNVTRMKEHLLNPRACKSPHGFLFSQKAARLCNSEVSVRSD
jgi:hypothetical protein